MTGLWDEMRAEAICRSSQKMSDHRVAHIFSVARAFAPKPQHIALSPRWALTVNANWRMVFAFDGVDAVVVDYKDYH